MDDTYLHKKTDHFQSRKDKGKENSSIQLLSLTFTHTPTRVRNFVTQKGPSSDLNTGRVLLAGSGEASSSLGTFQGWGTMK